VGVKQGVWQMNIHLHIIAARVLNNFGVKGMYREEQRERAWRMRRFFVSPPKRARCWNETRFLVAFQAVFHANKAFCFSQKLLITEIKGCQQRDCCAEPATRQL
jgi:hypothetical protein